MGKKSKKENQAMVNEIENQKEIMEEEMEKEMTDEEIKIKELEAQVADLTAKLAYKLANSRSSQGSMRGKEIINLIEEAPTSIKDIAELLGISTRNVSSILSGLRKAGYIIHTDEQSRKYLVAKPSGIAESVLEETEQWTESN